MHKFAKQVDEAEVNMTPMLDIVFIMLIFFIVTASFIKEAGIEINTPKDQPSKPLDSPPDRAIAFRIDGNNRITFERRIIDIGSVSAIIKKESVERPDAPVVIIAADGAYTGNAIRIYDEAQAIGIAPDKVVVMKK